MKHSIFHSKNFELRRLHGIIIRIMNQHWTKHLYKFPRQPRSVAKIPVHISFQGQVLRYCNT